MSLIVVERANLAFGGQPILQQASLRIGERERIGLIGPNGSGKSTLLKVLCGTQALDGGEVRVSKETRIGYLSQDVSELAGETLLGSVLSSVPGRADIEQRMASAQQQLQACADPADQMQLATVLGELGEQLEHFEIYYGDQRAQEILAGLRFEENDFDRPIDQFSGGWKMRAALAGLLFKGPDVLFLDEPTNHLDVPSVRWLDQFLRECRSALVIICHDREFLNRHIERVVSFEPEGLRHYRGNYDAYLEQRESEQDVLQARARNREKELKDMERFVERFRSKANKARQAQSRAKMVKRLQKELEGERRPRERATLSFSFPEAPRSGRDALTLSGISKSFGELHLYRDLDRMVYAGDRIAIVGVNGAGKTTLLKIMAQELTPDAGEVRLGANVVPGYYAQHHTDQLHRGSTVLEEVWRVVPERNETSIRSVCGAFLFRGDEVDKPVSVLSGGERARVLIARLLVQPTNLLMMDEPTNHLDLASAEALAEALDSYAGALVFVSHNGSFVNRLATKVWDVAHGGVIEHPGNLADYLQRLDDQKTRAEAQPVQQSAARSPSNSGRSGESQQQKKARKRQEAQQRNALARKTRDLRRSIAELERRISELERRQKELEPMLADPEVYQDKPRFQQTLEAYQDARGKLGELYGRWEHQQEQLAALEESP